MGRRGVTPRRPINGRNYMWAYIGELIGTAPWLSPMKFVVTLDEPAAHLLDEMLVTSGFVILGLLLTLLENRAEMQAVATIS